MLERKWIYLISISVGVLALSGICIFAFFYPFKSEPRVSDDSQNQGSEIPTVDLGNLSEGELRGLFSKGTVSMPDFAASILKAFETGKSQQAEKIFYSGQPAMLRDSKRTEDFVQKLVTKSSKEKSNSMIAALKLLEDDKERRFALKPAFQQRKTKLFKALLDEEGLVSTGPIFLSEAMGKHLTIFDIVAAANTSLRMEYLPILFANVKAQISFTVPDYFSKAVALDGDEYVKNLLDPQRCPDEELKIIFLSLVSVCSDTKDTKEYQNLLSAIKTLANDCRTKKVVQFDAEKLDELKENMNIELARALYGLSVRGWKRAAVDVGGGLITILPPLFSAYNIGKSISEGVVQISSCLSTEQTFPVV